MKTKTIHIALLLIALAFSAYASGQQELTIKDPFSTESIYHGEVSPMFKAKLYPNPTYLSMVKISWPDWAEIDMIQLNNITTNQVRIVEVPKGERKILVSDLIAGTYVVKFVKENNILGTAKLMVY